MSWLHDNRTPYYTTHKESPGQTRITCEGRRVIRAALLFPCVTNSSVLVGTTVICISDNDKPSGTGQTFSPLPLGFVARSRPAASAGSSAAVPVSGSPAGRNLSRVPDPQLVPEQGGKQTHTGMGQLVSGRLHICTVCDQHHQDKIQNTAVISWPSFTPH